MLGSSVRTLVARTMIQKRALEAPNGLASTPKGFARISTVRAFVARASSSGHRRGIPSNRPVSDPSMAHLP